MVDLPRRNPELIVQGFTVPGVQNTTVLSYRGPWARGVVYNIGDLASFQQEDGRPGLLLLCTNAHVSGDIFDSSEWAAIIDYEKLVSESDTSGLAARVEALETTIENGDFPLVDGDETEILIKRLTEAEIAALPSQIVAQGEFWYCTDSSPNKLVFGNGTDEFDDLVNLLLNDVTPELTELYNNTVEAQVASETASELAKLWATAAPGIEPEPGFQSALASAIEAGTKLRILAGFPSREATTATSLQKTVDQLDPKDEFGFIIFKSLSADADLTLPRDWNTTPGPAGRPAWIACKVVNLDTVDDVNFVTEGSAPAAVVVNAVWGAPIRFTVDPPLTHENVVTTRTVPAGVNRVCVITVGDISQATTSHQIGLSADVGVLTEIVAATAPTGNFSGGNRPSIRMWKLVLPDSALAPTDVTFTFTIPDKLYSGAYKIRSAANVNSVGNPAGSSVATPSLAPTCSVAAGNNSIACFDIFVQGKPTPVTDIDELTSADAQITSGTLKLKDILVIGGRIDVVTAATKTLLATLTSDDAGNPKKYGYGVYTFEPAPSGGAATSILAGPTSIAPGETATIYALNDGRSYIIEKGA